MSTSLQTILGALQGGMSGLEQMRVEKKQKEEEDRIAMDRRMQLDKSMRDERLKAVMSGMIPSASFNPSNMITGIPDMPGATPRQPAYRDTFGGAEFVMPELPQVTEHREGIEKMQRAKASDVIKKTALAQAWMAAGVTPQEAMAYANAGVSVPANRLAPETQPNWQNPEYVQYEKDRDARRARKVGSTGGSAVSVKEQAKHDADVQKANAFFNTPQNDNALAELTNSTYQNIKSAYPDMSEDDVRVMLFNAIGQRMKASNLAARTSASTAAAAKSEATVSAPRRGIAGNVPAGLTPRDTTPSRGEAASAATAPVVPRLPGETPAAYMKRTSGM
jgi:hypothetical protein